MYKLTAQLTGTSDRFQQVYKMASNSYKTNNPLEQSGKFSETGQEYNLGQVKMTL